MDNVNNLNGVPNFGHGFDNEADQVSTPMIEEETETIPEETPEEEVEISNTEETE